MAITNVLIHFKTKAVFEAELSANNIPDKSIVFIQDTREIYTHKTGYQAIPTGGTEGQILGMKNGKVQWLDFDDSKYALKENFWVGSSEEYEEIETPDENTFYFIYEEEGQTAFLTAEAAKAMFLTKDALNDYSTTLEVENMIELRATEVAQSAVNAFKNGEYSTQMGAKADKSELIGLATQEWVGQQGYLQSHQSLDGYVKTTAIEDMATKTWVSNQNYLTQSNLEVALQPYAKSAELDEKYVAKEAGKKLTTEDYTTEEKSKVANTPTFWSGTESEYEALTTKDDTTIYLIVEE